MWTTTYVDKMYDTDDEKPFLNQNNTSGHTGCLAIEPSEIHMAVHLIQWLEYFF